MGGGRGSRWVRPGAPGSRTTRLELFYDLVFVFAFLNVTTIAARDLNVLSLLSGLVALGLLWVALYLPASAAVALRTFRRVRPPLVVTAAVVLVLAPATDRMPALVALTLLTGVTLALVALELCTGRDVRRRMHEAESAGQDAIEAEANRWRRRHL